MLKKWFDNAEEYLLVGSLAFNVVLVFFQVVMRYVFQNSLSWSEELARYIFLWQTWVGASYAVEAEWGPDGATCLNGSNARHPELNIACDIPACGASFASGGLIQSGKML